MTRGELRSLRPAGPYGAAAIRQLLGRLEHLDASTLRAAQAPLKDTYREDLTAAVVTLAARLRRLTYHRQQHQPHPNQSPNDVG